MKYILAIVSLIGIACLIWGFFVNRSWKKRLINVLFAIRQDAEANNLKETEKQITRFLNQEFFNHD